MSFKHYFRNFVGACLVALLANVQCGVANPLDIDGFLKRVNLESAKDLIWGPAIDKCALALSVSKKDDRLLITLYMKNLGNSEVAFAYDRNSPFKGVLFFASKSLQGEPIPPDDQIRRISAMRVSVAPGEVYSINLDISHQVFSPYSQINAVVYIGSGDQEFKLVSNAVAVPR